MSQVYSVTLFGFKFKDEEGAKKAVQRRIARGQEDHVNYSTDHYTKDLRLDLDDMGDLLRMIFAGWNGTWNMVDRPGWKSAGFNAHYGWEGVMMTAFEDIAPFLEEGAELTIDVDEGRDYGVVRDGKAVWV